VADRLSLDALLNEATGVGPVLGIDTCGPIASLGVVTNGWVVAALRRHVASHCGGLPAAVDDVLAAAKITLADVLGVAVALGPGSFTGLRIALSYAKGIVAASGRAIVGVPTLDAMALCATPAKLPDGALVCPIIDARKDEVYGALYRVVTDTLEKISGDFVVNAKDLLPRITSEVFLIGDSKAEEVSGLLRAEGRRAVVLEAAVLNQKGSTVAAVGAARVARNEADAVATLEPHYVRPSDASVYFTVIKSGEINGTPRGRAHTAVRRA